ncbi:MAG: septal ring lytic transglycosylase RlpA family protein [Xanthomonadaceae bacterium]|nr:septal ring lytic transglycosylase RlpA family protein [Xanthomonadaceae bacterium]
MRGWPRTAAGVAALLLAACASGPTPSRPPYRPPVHRPASPDSAALPPAPASEKDRPPAADEIPPNLSAIPDAVPEPVERSKYGNPESYEVFGKRYEVLADARGFKERGHASWYGKKFHGRRTSSGEKYDMFAMSAAHKTLPIPTFARVTNLSNGKSVVVRVNDRGPFHDGRIVDLSYTAASKLDLIAHGSAEVELEVVDARGNTLAPPPGVVAATPPTPEPAPAPAPAVAVAAAVPSVSIPATGATTPPAGRPPRFLQAGVFNDTNNALTFRDYLRLNGVKPIIVKSTLRGGKWVYRVLIGPFDDPAALKSMREKLHADDTPTILVPE